MNDPSRPTETHIFELYHAGATWAVYIQAWNEPDAIARARKLPLARYMGVHEAQLPAQMGWLGRAAVWARNMGRRWYA